MRSLVIFLTFLVSAASAWAQEQAPGSEPGQAKTLSGMSVLGNNEAPKALVLVPWKSSQIGDGIGIVESLSNRPMPVDRDVFSRELDYYEIRTRSPEAPASPTDDLAVGSR
jgi:hypothetical protein